MIVNGFTPNAEYAAGDYVEDPDTGVVFMAVVSPDRPDDEGVVLADYRTPARNAEHFVIATDLPDR
jgi:hypothetical protein